MTSSILRHTFDSNTCTDNNLKSMDQHAKAIQKEAIRETAKPMIPGLNELAPPPLMRKQPGFIRVSGAIPVELNQRLKATARKQNITADQLIGELIIKSAIELDRWEAEQEVAKLKERFGANWIEVLKKAEADAA